MQALRVYRGFGRWRWLRTLVLPLLSLLSIPAAHAQDETDFLPPGEAFRLSVASVVDENAAGQIDVHFAIASAYYMYRARFAFEADAPGLLGQAQYPAGEQVDDPTFGEVMEIYRNAVTVRLPLQASLPPGESVRLSIVSQGCAEAGLCYPPMRQAVTLVAQAQGWGVQGEYARTQVPAPVFNASVNDNPGQIADLNDEGLAAYLRGVSRWQMVGVSFLLGLLLALTPCVLPMVPILLTLIAGQNTGKNAETRQSPGRWRGLGLALV